MAYSTDNPPACTSQRVGADHGAFWYYTSNDSLADVNTSGYFSNGVALGMKVGDVVFVWEADAKALSVAPVTDVNADGSVDVGDGTVLSAADSD